jgi:hypothetical protein
VSETTGEAGGVAYLQKLRARPDLSLPLGFFLLFLIHKIIAGELGGLAIMSAYFVGYFDAKLRATNTAASA